MADDIDRANDQQQSLLDAAISVARQRAVVSLYGNGTCIVCEGDAIPIGDKFGRFCGPECAREFER